ncbi:CGNR zinc finger domain-containing protein [Nocardioides marmorisolisilvae]|nr:CGNR zinc finger domain-containing protein [Nocardioides marmorisolisilvae]
MPVNPIPLPPEDEDLLAAFANLGHGEPDLLDDPVGLRSWWSDLGGSAIPGRSTDLELLRALRRSVRALALANNGVDVELEEDTWEAIPLRLVLTGGPHLESTGPTDLTGTIASAVASALVRSSARATWPRFKACPGPECEFVFRDRTRNGSRRWCLMSECGNRAKGAAFRARAARD